MIGSGKSSTAARIGDWLAGRGEDALVFREGATDHPIRTRAEDRLRAAADPQAPSGAADGSPGEYADEQWRQLAERCLRGQQTIILEASFLQNTVMPAFIDGAPMSTVDEVFTRIVGQAAPAEPLLVYLRPADTGAAVARVHRVRGEPWSSRNVAFVENTPWARLRGLRGQGAVVRLYQAWEPVAARLCSRYPFPNISVTDPQDNWPEAIARICAAVRPSQRGSAPRPGTAQPDAAPATPGVAAPVTRTAQPRP